MSVKRYERFTLIISDELKAKIEGLAERRYGDTSGKCVSRVVEDALIWQINRWTKYGMSLRDWLWSKLLSCPLPWIRQKAWGKLIGPYFED